MTQTSPETETLVAGAGDLPSKGHASLAQRAVAQCSKEPIDKKALLDIMNGNLFVHARRDDTFEIRGAEKAAEAILLVMASNSSTGQNTDRNCNRNPNA